jgi:hypothetical protein
MVSDNMPTGRHHEAPKHGDALLAGLVRCRRCGRKLTVRYTGAKHNIPRYSCWRGSLDKASHAASHSEDWVPTTPSRKLFCGLSNRER